MCLCVCLCVRLCAVCVRASVCVSVCGSGGCRCVLEDVGDGDGGGSRHPGVAVDQHVGAVLPGIICKETGGQQLSS